MATVCKRATYSGDVQGVGFRYTARAVASGFAVAGYVRNLSNGQVEVVAEGESDAVAGFLAAVAKRMGGYVTGSNVADESPAGFVDFGIRY
jgi:acylphosphatase